MLRFATAVKQRYVIAEAPPSEDYPPKNIADMLKQCKALGRDDLADQIKMQWHKVLNKYPETRLKWGAAVNIATSSIKKNIFGGKDFDSWLQDQEELSAEQKAAAKAVPTIIPMPKGTPAIAIPKKDETPEQWQEEAAKTKEGYIAAKKAFGDVKDYIAYLEKEAADLKKKIKTYGEGGEKSTTKSGQPSKYSARVPKWEELLKTALELIENTKTNLKEVEKDFKEAVTNYNNSPVVTVAYEKKAQEGLDNILEYVLNLKDLDKQRELLEKLNAAMGNKTTAGLEEVVAADKVSSLIQKMKDGLKAIMTWIKGLRASVSAFGKLAAMRY